MTKHQARRILEEYLEDVTLEVRNGVCHVVSTSGEVLSWGPTWKAAIRPILKAVARAA